MPDHEVYPLFYKLDETKAELQKIEEEYDVALPLKVKLEEELEQKLADRVACIWI